MYYGPFGRHHHAESQSIITREETYDQNTHLDMPNGILNATKGHLFINLVWL